MNPKLTLTQQSDALHPAPSSPMENHQSGSVFDRAHFLLPTTEHMLLTFIEPWTDPREPAAQHKRLCHKLYLDTFSQLGRRPMNNTVLTETGRQLATQLTEYHATALDALSAAPPFDPRVQDVKRTAKKYYDLLQQTLSRDGAILPKAVSGLRYSCARLHNGRFLYLINTPKPETIVYLEALRRHLPAFATQPLKPYTDRPKKLLLGQGSFGRVRLGMIAPVESDTGQQSPIPVAVKKIRNASIAEREIEQHLKIQSPFVPYFYGYCKKYSTWHTPEKYYLVQALVQGRTSVEVAASLAFKTTIPGFNREAETVRIARLYAQAAHSLHQQGCYHSDIKPENFLHDAQGQVYLIDLGMCHENNHLHLGGTQKYEPPETRSYNYRADKHDSFSLGLTIAALILGGDNHFADALNFKSSPQLDGRSHHFQLLKVPNAYLLRYTGLVNTKGLQVNQLVDLVIRLLDQNPDDRLSISDAAAIFDQRELAHDMTNPSIMLSQSIDSSNGTMH